MKQKYIAGLGAGVMDYLQVVDTFPKMNTKMRSSVADLQCGGSAMTALVTLAQLGVATMALTVVGKDPIGEMIMKDLENHGVNTKLIQKKAQHLSSLSSVLIAKETRTIIGHYELEDKLDLKKIKDSVWRSVQLLHLDGHHAAAALLAARKVRKLGGLISVDGGHASPDIEALLPYAHIMIMSETFLLERAKQKEIGVHMKQLYQKYQPRVLIITRGEKGVWYWDGDRVKKVPAFKVNAKDTTGAGDVFHGAFLYGYLKGWPLLKSIQFGQAASALKVQYLGARQGIPSKKLIEGFLQHQ